MIKQTIDLLNGESNVNIKGLSVVGLSEAAKNLRDGNSRRNNQVQLAQFIMAWCANTFFDGLSKGTGKMVYSTKFNNYSSLLDAADSFVKQNFRQQELCRTGSAEELKIQL